MLVIFFTYWAGMFLQGAESNVSVDIDILQWVVVVTNAMFVVVIVVIALRGSTAKAQRDGEESSPVPDSYSGRDSLSRQVSRIRREGSMAGRAMKLIQTNMRRKSRDRLEERKRLRKSTSTKFHTRNLQIINSNRKSRN